MRPVPYLVAYGGERYVAEAATVANTLLLPMDRIIPIADQILAHGLSVLLFMPVRTSVLQGVDTGQYRAELEMFRRGYAEAGILHRIVGVCADEELYSRALGGAFDDLPGVKGMDPYVRADAICAGLNRAAKDIKAVFPGVPVGHVETGWTTTRTRADWYRPVPEELDWLGVDAYIPGPRITRAAFEAYVRPAYLAAAKAGKPLLGVVQTFTGAPGDVWQAMPTVDQLLWWMALADELPSLVGWAWFTLDRTSLGTSLLDYPDRLWSVQWYRDYCSSAWER